MRELCEQCGLPLRECSAIAEGRAAAERFLRDMGVAPLDARRRAAELIQHPKREAVTAVIAVDGRDR